MRLKKHTLISALPALIPSQIVVSGTGEIVPLSVLQSKLYSITGFVQSETIRLFSQHKKELLTELAKYTGVPQPAEFGRIVGLVMNKSALTREIKAKSRIERLVRYKLISETDSYVKNPQGNKQEPSFSRAINLGAVDSQMVLLRLTGEHEITLSWKCWDAEYDIIFNIPDYIMKRDIVKFSLPIVKLDKNTGNYVFIFSITEQARNRKGNKHVIGIDLGVVKPYSMVVVNSDHQRVASYESSARLNRLARKRERLIVESRNIKSKIRKLNMHDQDTRLHELEYSRTRAKATRLTNTIAQQSGSEIAHKLTKHNSNIIHLEQLNWVSGTSKSKIDSSSWAHSKTQEAITQATKRIGYEVKKVSARNTSQECYFCAKKITHNTKSRTVWCGDCKILLDRDYNAAMNIAINRASTRPASQQLNGEITSKKSNIAQIVSTGAFIGLLTHSSP